MSNAVAAAIQILSGFLSDKYGRKRIHALSTLLAVFPPLMYALATNWTDLVPWVMLSGLATGLYIPVRWSIIADVSSTKTMASAYSWTNVSWLVGATVAPFIGGIVADLFGIRFPFFLACILRFAAFPLTLLMQETKRKPKPQRTDRNNEKTGVTDRYLLTLAMFSLINIIQGIGMGVNGPVVPIFVARTFHADYTFIGTLYAIGFGVASIIVQIPAGKCSDRFDRRKIMFTAFLASSPFFLLFAFSRNTLELILFMFAQNAILNLSWSPFQTLMMDATPSSKWGLVNGVSATTFWIGILTGNALSGVLWDNYGMTTPFYVSSIAIALSVLPLLLLKETKTKA